MKRLWIVALATVAFALPASAALPEQTDARDDPKVTGPLSESDQQCNRQEERFAGKLVAYTRTCLRIYTFNPNQETNVQRDYGTVWLQTNVNAENGWCAKVIRSQIVFPSNIAVHQRNPKTETTVNKATVVTQRLVNAAGGNATSNGRISQEFVLFPKKQTRSQVDEGDTQRVIWRGSEKRKQFFQTAANFSWNILDTPGQFRSGVGFRFEKDATC